MCGQTLIKKIVTALCYYDFRIRGITEVEIIQ